MFEKYTERARRVIFFSRYEAGQIGAEAIGAEEILLGLLREDLPMMKFFSASAEKISDDLKREMSLRFTNRDRISPSQDMSLSPSAKRVLENASDESARLNHHHIGSEHLLLGVLREENTLACELLLRYGFTLDKVRHEIFRSYEAGPIDFRTTSTINVAPESHLTQLLEQTTALAFAIDSLLELLVTRGLITEAERRKITGTDSESN